MSIDDENYYNDPRVNGANSIFSRVDIDKMIGWIELYDEDGDSEEVEVSIKYRVCPTCQGRGSHVNPSIDAGGLSREDFDSDPDFEENYYGGAYDVSCYECGSKRVSPELDDVPPELMERLESKWRGEADDAAERAAERRFGC